MRKFLLAIFILFVLPFPVYKTQAAEYLDIVINEIAWMGTDVSFNDEWIELYNDTNNSINLDGWVLKADDGTPEIALTGAISANGFYLLERTDDETVPGISADLIYKGALGNKGEDLKLYDNLGSLIDEVNCSEEWFAGDNKTKQTMERTKSTGVGPLQSWQTSQNPGGTPKTENGPAPEKLPENGSRATEEGKVEAGPLPSYPTGIVFSEVLPSPEGPDAENEWIEIFNQNNFEVDLTNWKIKDKEGRITTYTFSPDSKISPFGYLVLLRPETKITLNNSGDGLELIYPNGEIRDSVTFGKASLGQSYNRTLSGWSWSSTLTPGAKNIIPTPLTKQEPSFAKASEGKEKSGVVPLTAAIGEKTSKSSHLAGWGGLSTLIIAFVIAIFSAIVILVLRRAQDKYKNN